jgi:flagella basal body P-ring formation protein FlgA
VQDSALALRRSIVKGELIQAHDIITVPVSPQQNYAVFYNKEDLIGRRVRTPITAKDPIKSRQLEPRYLVEEGKPVTIAFSTGGIFVEMSGISLQNGQAGEVVKVENLSSGKTITGKVIGARKISPIS